jgi:predicted RNA-binding protein with PIN domain
VKGATATALLRPALEAAVDVARAGEKATPVTPAPAPLKRYLNFARLPDPALEVARRVLDDDEAFRTRVAGATGEAVVGRPGWLYLQRPDGWQAELDRLLQEAAAAEMASKDERHERGAQRRLAGAEAALARAEAAARASATEALAAQRALEAEREAAEAVAAEVERLRDQLDQLGGERAELIRRLKGAEATANQRTSELRATRHELHMAQAELAGGDVAAPAPVEPAPPTVAEPEAPPPAGPDLDRLREVAAALVELVGAPASSRERPARRVPVGPPPGVYDDAPEAAEHLVRVPGVLVLVDGYNISHAQWHGLPPAEQRTRLLGACGELHARCGTEVEVVFDGAGEAPGYGGTSRDGVRHRFTPAGVEADDVILERIGHEPVARPVVVVSSDRRVRDGARQRGADVLGARQFLGVLRRAAPPAGA